MNYRKILMLLLLNVVLGSAHAGTYWVGSSNACNGNNVFDNLLQALFVAALNGDSTDEIRLTNTVTYTGNSNGTYELQDWSSTGAGILTIVGGYSDCFGSINGRTLVGHSNSSSFRVNTNNESTSQVTLRNLTLTKNINHGLEVHDGGVVFLDNVDIVDNDFSGVNVYNGGYLDVLASSQIRLHNNINNPWGGGIRCTGAGSAVTIRNIIEKNRAQKGGNVYVSSGCYVELKDGSRIVGGANSGGGGTDEGGGIFINDGGEVFADGRANRVIFDGNLANKGAAIFVTGSGFALLQNTHINNPGGDKGVAIYAVDGGTASPQLLMDQTTDCQLLFRCSEVQGARYDDSVIYVENSFIQLNQTVIEQSDFRDGAPEFANGLIDASSNARVRLNRVGFLRNETENILRISNVAEYEATHVTIAENQRVVGSNGSFVLMRLGGTLNIQNSLIQNSSGIDNRGGGASLSGDCNLIDNDADWPAGTYYLGQAQLINPAAGDGRQLASSLGVDMCQQDAFSWSSEIDIENQAAPVNENTNPQGLPGQSGGLFDAGFDEVYDNIGEDEFLLTVVREGTGGGAVASNPAGIACGADCSEVYFNGTIVTLYPLPSQGSVFSHWLNCPLSNDDDECLTQMSSSHTIRAVFQPSDLIFEDGFE